MEPILRALPPRIREKWMEKASSIADSSSYPSFKQFNNFIKFKASAAMTIQIYEPGAHLEARTFKSTALENEPAPTCPIHPTSNHSLASCRTFAMKTIQERETHSNTTPSGEPSKEQSVLITFHTTRN